MTQLTKNVKSPIFIFYIESLLSYLYQKKIHGQTSLALVFIPALRGLTVIQSYETGKCPNE